MIVTRYNPNAQMREFRRGFDMLNSMLDNFSPTTEVASTADFSPAINTREDDKVYYVEVDLPGMKKDNIEISVEENRLVISGERKLKEEVKKENYYKIESSLGKFSRSFTLPEDADIENIEAKVEDGILEVKVPKLELKDIQKSKKIEIK
ncbi:MAG: Hsp20/alpha crystallin family protein [Epsilonproteobacteria bacterium]|jgi:HSP20 family protein|nr:Hsp20/alpha crystallin family protein [Campylobacterota bacterium]